MESVFYQKDGNTAAGKRIASGTLYPRAPFDFAKSLRFLEGFTPLKGEQSLHSGTIGKAVQIEGRTVMFQLRSAGTVEKPELHYSLYAVETPEEKITARVVDRMQFFLGMEEDLSPFYRLAEKDPAFLPVMKSLYGYHQVKFLTPFENACWAILTQRVPMQEAKRTKSQLREQLGSSIEIDGCVYSAFPEPFDLLSAGADKLNALVRNERKTAYLLAASHAFLNVQEEFLRHGDYQQVKSFLREIKGIGEWSAAFILIRGLGRMEEVPGEKMLEKIVAARYQGLSVEEAAKPYESWRGYWAHYLRVYGLG